MAHEQIFLLAQDEVTGGEVHIVAQGPLPHLGVAARTRTELR